MPHLPPSPHDAEEALPKPLGALFDATEDRVAAGKQASEEVSAAYAVIDAALDLLGVPR